MRILQTIAAGFLLILISPAAIAQTSDEDKADRATESVSSPSGSSLNFTPSFTIGFDYSQGDFGADLDTTTLSVPVSARVDVGDFRFSVSTSWLQIEGPGGVVADGVVIGDGPTGLLETNNGIGDVTLGVNYNIPTENTGKFIIQLQGRLKLPVASTADSLGTGEFDGGGAVDIAYDLGKLTPFVTVGYRLRGDPEGADLNNTFSVSAGASYNLGGGYALLGSYDFRERTTDTSENSNEVFGAVTGKFNDTIRWTLYGSVGFTDGAPDQGAGAQLTFRF
ncbi:MAG: hypothetical protein ABJG15_01785 [Hyphomonadaceae bacterium]